MGMTETEAIHRAWVGLWLGTVILFLAALQLWAGKALLGFGWGWHPSPWFYRKKEPFQFWSRVGLLGALGIFVVAFSLTRLL
jgi:hypothetical protein